MRHLDTGLLYRAVGKAVLDAGQSSTTEAAAAAAQALDPSGSTRTALKSDAVGEAASIVSAIPEVRAALLAFQRDFAASRPARCSTGATSEP